MQEPDRAVEPVTVDKDTRAGARVDRWWLFLLAGASSIGYLALARWPFSNRAADVGLYLSIMALLSAGYATGWWLCARTEGRPELTRSLLPVLFTAAVLFRLILLTTGLPQERVAEAVLADLGGRPQRTDTFLLYDNDLWRYLWDGHVLAAGLDPYRTLPDEADEWGLIDEEPWPTVLTNVSYTRYHSIYPPLTQYWFAALAQLAPGSTLAARASLMLLDLALCWLLWRATRRAWVCLAYGWNPMVIAEFTGSGHPDPLMLLPLAAAVVLGRRRPLAAAIALGVGVLAKLTPVVAAPWLVGRRWSSAGVAMATVALGCLPLAAGLPAWFEAMARFGANWTFNSGAWLSLREVFDRMGVGAPERWADVVAAILLSLLLVRLWWRRDAVSLATATTIAVFGIVLLSPAVMPWYVLWLLPLALLIDDGGRSAVVAAVWAAVAQLSYLAYVDPAIGGGWKWIEYGVLAGALVVWQRRGGWRVDRSSLAR